MTAALHLCRHCREPIADPDDAVYLGHENGPTGPGWDVWAHREHVDQAGGPDPVAVTAVARLLLYEAFRS